jgi:hypothetical protein
MKRNFLCLALLSGLALSLAAQTPVATSLDTELASVDYVRRESIGLKQFKLSVSKLEAAAATKMTVDQRKQYLDLMINDLLFLQYCEKEKITITDAELSQSIQQMKAQVLQSLKQNPQGVDPGVISSWSSTGTISDDAFYGILTKLGVQASELKLYYKKQLLMKKYLDGKKGEISAIPAPSYEEVEKFYNEHKQSFYQPDALKLGIIFFDIRGKGDDEKAKIKAQAKAMAAKVSNNVDAFNEAVLRAKDNPKIGYTAISGYPFAKTADFQKVFGLPFYNAAFGLKKGQITDIVEGESGFHILLAEQVYPAHQLGLNEAVSLTQTATVFDYVKQSIYNEKVNGAVESMLNKLVDSVRAKSKIKTKPELLNW